VRLAGSGEPSTPTARDGLGASALIVLYSGLRLRFRHADPGNLRIGEWKTVPNEKVPDLFFAWKNRSGTLTPFPL
jgi:hypothetical protein